MQCDFEVRIVRDLTVQSLKLVSDAVRQHPDVGPAAHLYFSQVIHRSSAVFTRSLHTSSRVSLYHSSHNVLTVNRHLRPLTSLLYVIFMVALCNRPDHYIFAL